jgi:adenosylmethionine---8-amino-7-oxononanoate aminotransferase
LKSKHIKRFSARENQEPFLYAKGPFVNDVFDATLGGGCNIFGYSNPVWEKVKQEKYFMFSTSQFTHPVYDECAKRLSHKSLTDVYFPGTSGSDAIECALKAAYDYNGRTKYIARRGAFHGATHTANSLGNNKSFSQYKGMFKTNVIQMPMYRQTDFKKTISELAKEELDFIKKFDPEEIGAIVFEPFPGPSQQMRYRFDSPDCYNELRRYCTNHNIALIFDEIYSGFKIGGRYFTERLSIEPDILCLSKGLTSGVAPLSACVGKEGIFDKLHHGHTWSGYYLGVVAANETLKLVEEFKTHVEYMHNKFNHYFDNGIGMYWAFDSKKLKSIENVISRIVWDDTVLFTPPINTTEEEMEYVVKEMMHDSR